MLSNLFNLLSKKYPPGPSFSEVLSDIPSSDVFERYFSQPVDLMSRYGDFYRFPQLTRLYFVADPDAIGHITKTNQDNYIKENPLWMRLRVFFGSSGLTSYGADWAAKRELIQKAFHHQYLKEYAAEMSRIIPKFIQKWQGQTNKNIELSNLIYDLTITVIIRTLFQQAPTDQDLKLIKKSIGYCLWYACYAKVLAHRPWIPTFHHLKFHYYNRCLNSLLFKYIDNFKKQKLNGCLSVLIEGVEQAKQKGMHLEYNFIPNELKTLVITGQETTGCALAWTWYLLANHPQTMEKLQNELSHQLHGKTATINDLVNLPFNKAVFQEAMRLYPPIPILNRNSIQADEINGYYIPANTQFIIHIYAMHRNPKYWHDPNDFKPERFMEVAIQPNTYLPFGLGPRTCVGAQFGMLEGQLILATFAQHFTFKLDDNPANGRPQLVVSLRPEKLQGVLSANSFSETSNLDFAKASSSS